ncbi:hypothetical protein GO001_07075 [Streptomyces sp. NRRL B-1677]|uniref:Uncharacterized protein n=1 Tax=Streptomyces klenkii TaxID=1420899 RepID=A0A3B0BEV1_9ACTN|nr:MULTISPECIES: hypothetical protein [Streptomyces]MBF6044986.1 hypothetical protein [Streptomyces sp. NRRL B-1677]RKN70894.1 hypothetical protein D7231_18530 [Streptomyces klenkii]
MFALRNHPRSPRRRPVSRSAEADREAFAARVCAELADDLPEEDLTQDLDDCLDRYELGSKPRCEEVEYLEMVQDAIDRIERGC